MSDLRYYSAYVTDNLDPEQRGRLTLIVPALSGDDEAYPDWIEPRIVPGAGPAACGIFWIPPVNAIVLVEKDRGDDSIRWLGGQFGSVNTLPPVFAVGYPLVAGFTDPTGAHAVLVDGNAATGGVLLSTATGTIRLGASAAAAIQPIPLGIALLTDLQSAITDLVAGLAAVPYTATMAAAFATNLATSVAAGAPYLSARSFTE